jgi:hypothetical protein
LVGFTLIYPDSACRAEVFNEGGFDLTRHSPLAGGFRLALNGFELGLIGFEMGLFFWALMHFHWLFAEKLGLFRKITI